MITVANINGHPASNPMLGFGSFSDATNFYFFESNAERTTYLSGLPVVPTPTPNITFQFIGGDIIYLNNGIEIGREPFDSNHDFWDFDWSNIGLTEQLAISARIGKKPPLSGVLQKLSQAKTYVDNQIAAKKPEYPSGLGGTVTQLTNKATAVTINNIYGRITTHAAALAAGAEVTFTVNNNLVGATDFPQVALAGGGTIGAYNAWRSSVSAGAFTITISNHSAGSLSQAISIDFIIIKLN